MIYFWCKLPSGSMMWDRRRDRGQGKSRNVHLQSTANVILPWKWPSRDDARCEDIHKLYTNNSLIPESVPRKSFLEAAVLIGSLSQLSASALSDTSYSGPAVKWSVVFNSRPWGTWAGNVHKLGIVEWRHAGPQVPLSAKLVSPI